ncbi:PREDICTED: cytochrome c oxidase subunit 6B2 [Atta cephalotes]|uniref:Cytochrome c oxidase subunit n=2 Tax=Atta TaxID=12956 RepID=A0A158NX41_ATTCE|nr:PREDICTED: cytochrome c oxidase subunit 6B2 [Atta cephalotes]XP_018056258.1 PREDICTED: cytochrome c oxidase subunit 6B2-like isoform X2 [Atta colombica]
MIKLSDLDETKWHSVPYDPRFPNQNQTRYCYQNYVDFHRCKKKHNENYDACQYFKRAFTSMCPNAWVEKWNEQVETGTFAGRI